MKLAWKILIGLGIFLVLLSFGMDTTVSHGGGRIHNIGLQQDRQTMLILGCFMFLAGIVLYAVKKVKQTPEELAAEEKAQEQARQAAQQRVLAVTKVKVEDLGAVAEKIDMVLNKVQPGVDGIYIRLCVGVAVGLLWSVYSMQLSDSSGLAGTLPVLALVYSLWPSPWRTVITRLMVANVVFLILAFIKVCITISSSDREFDVEDVGKMLLLFMLPILLSVALSLFLRRKARPM